jgi:hypothetical protein
MVLDCAAVFLVNLVMRLLGGARLTSELYFDWISEGEVGVTGTRAEKMEEKCDHD